MSSSVEVPLLQESSEEPARPGFRERLFPEFKDRRVFDLSVVVASYFVVGAIFYNLCSENWPPMYAFFYAANVGLSVGYSEQHRVHTSFAKYVTVLYLIAGSSVIVGSLGVLVDSVAARARRRGRSELRVSFTLYASAVAFGLWAATFQKYTSFADVLLFVVGNYTTAGLITPINTFPSLFFTTLSIILGVPANFYFMSTLASTLGHAIYGHVDDDDDAAYRRYLENELLKAGLETSESLETVRSELKRQA